NFFIAGSGILIAALLIAMLCSSELQRALPMMTLLSLFILAASVTTSHAIARLEDRVALALITALHQLATAPWIGGLPYLVLRLRGCQSERAVQMIGSRFSRLAFISVITLAAAGLTLSTYYIDSIKAVYGTAYGVMVLAKIALFVMLLLLGAMNFFIVR